MFVFLCKHPPKMNFTLKKNTLSPSITALAKTAKNPTPVMRAMGTTFKSITEGTFNSVGSSYRPTPWPAKADGSPSNLQRSTTMSKAFQLSVTDKTATVSNPMIYARVHQLGAIIKAVNAKALSWLDNGVRRFAKKVKIPARPFFPILNGRLTPAAETKILAAGKRVIDKQSNP
jgi:phage gpG-like protein